MRVLSIQSDPILIFSFLSDPMRLLTTDPIRFRFCEYSPPPIQILSTASENHYCCSTWNGIRAVRNFVVFFENLFRPVIGGALVQKKIGMSQYITFKVMDFHQLSVVLAKHLVVKSSWAFSTLLHGLYLKYLPIGDLHLGDQSCLFYSQACPCCIHSAQIQY